MNFSSDWSFHHIHIVPYSFNRTHHWLRVPATDEIGATASRGSREIAKGKHMGRSEGDSQHVLRLNHPGRQVPFHELFITWEVIDSLNWPLTLNNVRLGEWNHSSLHQGAPVQPHSESIMASRSIHLHAAWRASRQGHLLSCKEKSAVSVFARVL